MEISDEELEKIKNGEIRTTSFDKAKELEQQKLTAEDFVDCSDLCQVDISPELRAELAINRLKNASRPRSGISLRELIMLIIIIGIVAVLYWFWLLTV